MTENVMESTTMIQPVLFSYSFQGAPQVWFTVLHFVVVCNFEFDSLAGSA